MRLLLLVALTALLGQLQAQESPAEKWEAAKVAYAKQTSQLEDLFLASVQVEAARLNLDPTKEDYAKKVEYARRQWHNGTIETSPKPFRALLKSHAKERYKVTCEAWKAFKASGVEKLNESDREMFVADRKLLTCAMGITGEPISRHVMADEFFLYYDRCSADALDEALGEPTSAKRDAKFTAIYEEITADVGAITLYFEFPVADVIAGPPARLVLSVPKWDEPLGLFGHSDSFLLKASDGRTIDFPYPLSKEEIAKVDNEWSMRFTAQLQPGAVVKRGLTIKTIPSVGFNYPTGETIGLDDPRKGKGFVLKIIDAKLHKNDGSQFTPGEKFFSGAR